MKLNRLYKFIFLTMLLGAGMLVNGQQTSLSVVPAPVVFATYATTDSIQPLGKSGLHVPLTLFTPAFSIMTLHPVIEPDYYTRHFGYFCKKELQFEKMTTLPLRFRLGTLDYVNKLEGK